jgi:hypothetical protein
VLAIGSPVATAPHVDTRLGAMWGFGGM